MKGYDEMKKISILLVAILCLAMVGCSNDSDNTIPTSTEKDPILETPVEGSLQYKDLNSDEISDERPEMGFEEEIHEDEYMEDEIHEEEIHEDEYIEDEYIEDEVME